jgi:hypothetical protein
MINWGRNFVERPSIRAGGMRLTENEYKQKPSLVDHLGENSMGAMEVE